MICMHHQYHLSWFNYEGVVFDFTELGWHLLLWWLHITLFVVTYMQRKHYHGSSTSTRLDTTASWIYHMNLLVHLHVGYSCDARLSARLVISKFIPNLSSVGGRNVSGVWVLTRRSRVRPLCRLLQYRHLPVCLIGLSKVWWCAKLSMVECA